MTGSRAAVKRAALGAFGAALAGVLPARAAAGPRGAGGCAKFCNALYGENTPETTACIQAAKTGKGACYQFGPLSPGCADNPCPPSTVCVSGSDYYSPYYGQFKPVCVPV